MATDREAGWPLSLAHLGLIDVGPPDLIWIAAKAGFASVGLRMTPVVPGGIAYPLSDAAAFRETRQQISATGVSILDIEVVSLHRDMDPRDHLRMIETGAALGASRIVAASDEADLAAVADRLAELCDLVAPYRFAVDLEFMPFRAVRSLADAIRVVTAAGRPNGYILVDALHFFRSDSDLATLARLDPALIGTFHLCDAPARPPPAAELAAEARTRRLLPGQGGLALESLMDALPGDVRIGVELPIAEQFPKLDPLARASLMVSATRAYLRHRGRGSG